MKNVYALSFEAQWRDDKQLVKGKQAYYVAITKGSMDAVLAILACQIVAASWGTILYPDQGVDIFTFPFGDMKRVPLWTDGWIEVY